MTNEKMEQRLAAALEKTAPDDVSGVLSRCEERKGNGHSHDNKENDKEKMDIAHCRLSCGDAAWRRAVLPASERGCVRGVTGCEPEH